MLGRSRSPTRLKMMTLVSPAARSAGLSTASTIWTSPGWRVGARYFESARRSCDKRAKRSHEDYALANDSMLVPVTVDRAAVDLLFLERTQLIDDA